MKIGSQRLKYNSFLDEYSMRSTARDKMSSTSKGRNFSQRKSKFAVERKTGQTMAARQTSSGEVRDSTCKMHSSGNLPKSTITAASLPFSPAILRAKAMRTRTRVGNYSSPKAVSEWMNEWRHVIFKDLNKFKYKFQESFTWHPLNNTEIAYALFHFFKKVFFFIYLCFSIF